MIRSQKTGLLAGLFILLYCAPTSAEKVTVFPQDEANSIHKKISELSAGDTMIFNPGIYSGPFTLNGMSGMQNLPIVITGISEGSDTAAIDGKSEPGMDLHNNAFQLEECSWIVIEGFRIRHCWTDIITAVDVSYLSVKQCDVVGGKRLLYAMGRATPWQVQAL